MTGPNPNADPDPDRNPITLTLTLTLRALTLTHPNQGSTRPRGRRGRGDGAGHLRSCALVTKWCPSKTTRAPSATTSTHTDIDAVAALLAASRTPTLSSSEAGPRGLGLGLGFLRVRVLSRAKEAKRPRQVDSSYPTYSRAKSYPALRFTTPLVKSVRQSRTTCDEGRSHDTKAFKIHACECSQNHGSGQPGLST